MRTTGQIYIDFNPSEEFWIHTKVHKLKGKTTRWIRSTYKDNPFLEQSIVDAIVSLRDIDEQLWRVYGLGELGVPKEVVFPRWSEAEIPEDDRILRLMVWTSVIRKRPLSTVIDLYLLDGCIYLDEIIYRTGLTNPELYNLLKETRPTK